MPKKKEQVAEMFESVTDGLKQLYRAKVRPIEELYRFGDFYSPLLTDGDFEAKPMVLLMGQYSVGKTSFIRYLLGRDFPGQHIGPEPTTDRFIAVMHGNEDKSTPGNALAVSQNMPFRGLEMFGNGFLSKFQGAQLDAPLLHHVTLIDTPGNLATAKEVARPWQRQSRPPTARGRPRACARRPSALRSGARGTTARAPQWLLSPQCRPPEPLRSACMATRAVLDVLRALAAQVHDAFVRRRRRAAHRRVRRLGGPPHLARPAARAHRGRAG